MEPSRFCIAGLYKANLVAAGMPPDLADEFFRDDTPLTLQVSGNAAIVSSGSVLYGVRFFGEAVSGSQCNTRIECMEEVLHVNVSAVVFWRA